MESKIRKHKLDIKDILYNCHRNRFFQKLFLWIIGLILSFIPVLYKQINLYFHNISNFSFKGIMTDKDLMFTFFSTTFLLLLESILSDNKKNNVNGVFRIVSLFLTVFFVVWYTISIFSDNWDEYVENDYIYCFHVCIFISIIILGIVYFVISCCHS